MEAQEGRKSRVPVERLTSGAVIADARCNLSILSLLCSPSFLIILSAIYQIMKPERTKKKSIVVSLHYGLCQVLWGKKCFVCSLFLWRKKKKLVVCEDYLILFSLLLLVFIFRFPKIFSVVSELLSWEKPKSMHFSGSCKRDVCLFDNTSKSVTGWDLKSTKKKCRLSYFYNWLYLCILYQWNFFILEIKGYNNKKKS